jgi:hypothetical protein
MKLRIEKSDRFSEAFPSTKSYINMISKLEFPSLISVQEELRKNGPPFNNLRSIEKLVLEGNPMFYHAPYLEVKDKLQALYSELIDKHNPKIAEKLYVDTRIRDFTVSELPLLIQELPIREVIHLPDYANTIVANVVAKEQT